MNDYNPSFAKQITIEAGPGVDFTFTINGEPFPYQVSSIDLDPLSPDGIPAVLVRIPADHINITNEIHGR